MTNSKPLFFRVNKAKPLDQEILKAIDSLERALGSRSEALRALVQGGVALYNTGELHQTIGQMKDKK